MEEYAFFFFFLETRLPHIIQRFNSNNSCLKEWHLSKHEDITKRLISYFQEIHGAILTVL